MLRDITIGQHFPGNSLVHRFDPRLKLVLTIAYIVLLFAASNPLGLVLIDEPQGVYYGGVIAAPVMAEIFQNVLPYLDNL